MKFARPLSSSVRLAALSFAALLAFGLSNPAFAQWKWKDKNGHTQYSDLPPPPSVSDIEILQRPNGGSRHSPMPTPGTAQAAASAMAASAAASSPVEPELEAKRRKAADDEAAKRKAEDAKANAARTENCQRAKSQLRTLDDGMRMARVNAKGEREILDDKGRAEESQRARDIIATDCK